MLLLLGQRRQIVMARAYDILAPRRGIYIGKAALIVNYFYFNLRFTVDCGVLVDKNLHFTIDTACWSMHTRFFTYARAMCV